VSVKSIASIHRKAWGQSPTLSAEDRSYLCPSVILRASDVGEKAITELCHNSMWINAHKSRNVGRTSILVSAPLQKFFFRELSLPPPLPLGSTPLAKSLDATTGYMETGVTLKCAALTIHPTNSWRVNAALCAAGGLIALVIGSMVTVRFRV